MRRKRKRDIFTTYGGIKPKEIFAIQMARTDDRFLGLCKKLLSVKINVHYFLPHLTNDQDVVEVEGRTIGQCLEKLVARFPKVREWLFGKDGNLSNLVDVYVNLESAYPEGLAKLVKDGDEIHIIMMISGG